MRELTHRPGVRARCAWSIVHKVSTWGVLGDMITLLVQMVPRWAVPTQQKPVSGCFWLPCRGCGEWCSGANWGCLCGDHEASIPVPGSLFRGWGICTACALDGVGNSAWEALRREQP